MFQNYLKIAVRNLFRNNVYSIINILGLTLGILGSIIIFQLVKYHLNTDSYHLKAKRIYRVVNDLHLDDGSVEKEKGSPFILHKTLKNDFAAVEYVTYIAKEQVTFSIIKKNNIIKYKEKTGAVFTNDQYFKIFDYDWLVGKPNLLNQPNNVILTEKFAKKYFGKENPIGKIIRINNLQDIKVSGLLKDYTENTDFKNEVFISLPTIKAIYPDYGYEDWTWFSKNRETYISLLTNNNKQNIESQFPLFSKKYYGESAKYFHFHLQELSDVHFNVDYGGIIRKSTIFILMFLGFVLTLIACINFINLTNAQSFKRFKEIGIRKAIGSSQGQIFWQFITEISLIVLISVSLALLLGLMAIPTLNTWFKTQITISQYFDGKLLIFIPILIILTIFTAGFYPSLKISSLSPLYTLKGIINGFDKGILIRKGLVIAQFSISSILIAVSILIISQINFLKNKDIGSDKDLILQVNMPSNKGDVLIPFGNQLSQKSFIKNFSFCRNAPSSEIGNGGQVKFDNRDWEKFAVRSKVADDNYTSTYGIKLLLGRKPIHSDTINEVLINQRLVKQLGLQNLEDAMGKNLFIGDGGGDGGKKGKIVGIMSDFNNTDLYTHIEPTIVFSTQNRYKQVAIKLNNLDLMEAIKQIQKIWEKIYPNDVFEYSFYDQELAAFYEKEDLLNKLIICFALASIFISCLGLFGLANFTIVKRTKEIGIRKVLGSSVSQIVTLLTKDFLKLVIISFLIAVPLSWYIMNKWLQNFAFRIEISWWMFAIAGVLSLLIAILTVSFQAIKAAMANPVESLRSE